MKYALIALATSAACLCAPSFAMDKGEYKAQKQSIEQGYSTNVDACDSKAGYAKSVCLSEAKGARAVALSELEGQYSPNTVHNYKTRVVRAETTYETAKEKCRELSGDEKKVCRTDAKAAYVRARADAKARPSGSDARADAEADKRDAEYAAARNRCDILSGDAKDSCVADLKLRFGKG